jgi:UDP-2,3-diacylglucosamine hydrolase
MTQKPCPTVILPPPVYFLSDAHLGSERGEKALEQCVNLDRFFDEVLLNGKSLVLAGDLFDFWYEWRTVVPKQHFHTLYGLHTLSKAGIEIHYLAGNHDFRLRGFLESEIGLHTHLDGISAQIGKDRVFVYHGDGILGRDHGYRLLKGVLRSRVSQRIFSWLHPDLGMLLARGTSMTSRSNTEKGDPAEDLEYENFARRKLSEGYTGVVLGHSHRPKEVVEGEAVYINLGDWITYYTYGLHDGMRLSLKHLTSPVLSES